MKKLLALCLLTLSGLCACSSNPNIYEGNTPIYAGEGEVTSYLVLTVNGLYEGAKGQNNETLFLENVVEYSAKVGDPLPGSDKVTNTVSGVTFAGWIHYDNNIPTTYKTVTPGISIYYASWDNDGTAGSVAGGAGGDIGDIGGDVGGGGTDTPVGNSDWYIVGDGSFVNGNIWDASGGIRMSVNPYYEGDGIEYMATVTFEDGDLWKIMNPITNEWIQRGWESGNTGSAIDLGQMKETKDKDGNSNIEVLVSGTYDIYFKYKNSNDNSVWISGKK